MKADYYIKMMTKDQRESLKLIEDQLLAINARNISAHWIGLQEKPTMDQILELNELLGFLIKEIRTLRETGKLDADKLHCEYFDHARTK